MNAIRQKKVENNADKGNYCAIQVRKPHRQFGRQDRMDKGRIKITDTASRLNRQQMGQYCNQGCGNPYESAKAVKRFLGRAVSAILFFKGYSCDGLATPATEPHTTGTNFTARNYGF